MKNYALICIEIEQNKELQNIFKGVELNYCKFKNFIVECN